MAAYDIGEAFQIIEEEMIASMARNLKRHLQTEHKEGLNYSMWQAEQLAALNNFRKDNKKKFSGYFSTINSQIEDVLKKAYASGEMQQEAAILEAIRDGAKIYNYDSAKTIRGQFFKINERKLNALIEATKNDMAKAETAMLRTADDGYRKIIYNSQVYLNTGVGTLSQAVDMASKDFLSRGITCIEYANGARVGIDVYSRMALRTAQTRAYLQGESGKRDEWGVNTVIVNRRGVACPKCLRYVGNVFYDDVWGNLPVPSPAKYPKLSEAISGGLYHPNCKDIHTTYFEDISDPPRPMTQKEIDEANRVYALEQQQRYNERMIRKYKRLSDGSVDPQNVAKYKEKLAYWQETQREFVAANSDVLKRRPELEKVFKLPDNSQTIHDYDVEDGIIKEDLCAASHTWVEEIIDYPTCDSPGAKFKKCAICGEEGEEEEIPPTGHKWLEVSAKPPTCTDPGERLLRCEYCSKEKTEIIPAAGHRYGKTYTEAPTCTEEGYNWKQCAVCGHIEIFDKKPALDHDWGDWVITRQPTTTLHGRKQKTCKRCGEKKYTTIPKLKATSTDQQIKTLEDSIAKLNTEMDVLKQTDYTGIWKDPVTVADYSIKAPAIAAKKQYFMDQIVAGDTSKDWWQLIDLTDEFEQKGKEYEALLAQRQKNQDALDLLKPPTPGASSGPFTPDAYGKRKTDAWNSRFRVDMQADAYYRPIYDKQCGRLTDEQKFGIWQYTHNSHPMNRPLCGYNGSWGRSSYEGLGKISWDNENTNYDGILNTSAFQKKFANKTVRFNKVRDYTDTIADLTQAIDQCEFDKDTWVVRGSDKNGLIGLLEHTSGLSTKQLESIVNSGSAQQLQALIGKQGQSHSFMSTGIVDGKGFGGGVSYKIYLPKGTKAVYAEPQSYWGDTHYHKEKIYKPGDRYSSISHEAEIIIQRGTTYRVADIKRTSGNIEVVLEVVDQPNYFKTGYEHTHNDGRTSEK